MQEPVPAEPSELTRRRAVRSFQAVREPQLAVAQLFSLMDLMCFETALLRPDLRARLIERHSELTASMAAATPPDGRSRRATELWLAPILQILARPLRLRRA